ncbi:TPA: hypothetical protein P2N04_001104 [Aeromonas salmonicida]|uniref:Uncharacterized protein n=1 Tax=Aeromonas salmonicida subsp. salmonicida TaxID=29491 RepID=A0A8F3IUV6_AERSS|nr:hypothetical protein [Aeromonas salmonicida]MBM9522602.1 hypothetical protein [Aeromonas salmonicida subsp. salmonicida]QWY91840.1 hypothetical protein [Aeromonas salmonicida subsp. salmonicida]HDN9804049.1 hypothetical protein [Aeromonas salmonicida]HDO0961133.1 hypothetical protein [Aeromonas salmonicida]HDO0965760.1 hypothetical protein [Aeromonas salmonicida]
MGLIQSMQGQQPQQPQQQGGNDDAMHASLMEMLGATLLGDGGQAVAGRLQAGEDKIQGVADAVAGGIFTILKQAMEAGRGVPAQQIVKAVYAGCREMLTSGKIGDPDSKIDALFRAMDKLKEMDAENDVIDDQILAEASQILEAIVKKMDEAEQQGGAA